MSADPSPASPRPPEPAKFGIRLGDSAYERIRGLMSERSGGLRLAVKGGGCSGLAYRMEWAEVPKERDRIFERDGVRIFVDPKSYLYLMGTELVYEDTMAASGFRLKNPNEKASCGCGLSFSV